MGNKDNVWTGNHLGVRIHGAIVLGMLILRVVQELKGFHHFLDKKTTVLGNVSVENKEYI